MSKDNKQFSKGPITKDEYQKLKDIFDALEKDPQGYDFLEPVDYVGLGLDDYPSIVKNPMDISTIKKNLKNNKYTSLQEVFNDIQLIWENCRLYNMEGSEIYKMANHCEKLVKRLIDKYFKVGAAGRTSTKKEKAPTQEPKQESNLADEDDQIDEAESGDILNLQEKIGITDRIRKLTNQGLAALVRLIQKECSQALEEIDSEKLQIRVDSIDRKTYDQINQLIDTLSKVKEVNADNLGKKIKA